MLETDPNHFRSHRAGAALSNQIQASRVHLAPHYTIASPLVYKPPALPRRRSETHEAYSPRFQTGRQTYGILRAAAHITTLGHIKNWEGRLRCPFSRRRRRVASRGGIASAANRGRQARRRTRSKIGQNRRCQNFRFVMRMYRMIEMTRLTRVIKCHHVFWVSSSVTSVVEVSGRR